MDRGGLACCNSWGCKESDMTEWLIWLTTLKRMSSVYGGDMRHTSKSQEREIKWAWRILQNMCQKQSVISQYPWIPYISSFPEGGGSHVTHSGQWAEAKPSEKVHRRMEHSTMSNASGGASMLGTENWLWSLALWRLLLNMIKIVSL